MYFDSHVHWAFLNDRELNEMMRWYKSHQVLSVIQGGYNEEDWRRQIKQKEVLEGVTSFLCFGLHPWALKNLDDYQIESQLKNLEHLVQVHRCFLGELGLDKTVVESDKDNEIQEDVFRRQLKLAKRFGRPIVLHVVKRHNRVFSILDAMDHQFSGFVHGFYGSLETAREYLKRGLKISIGPLVLRPENNKLESVVKDLQLKQMVFESDFPSEKKSPQKGQSSDLLKVYNKVCEIKGMELTDIKESSKENLTSLLDDKVF